MDMYDKFIDSDIVHTQELLSIGLNKNDLTKLVETGKLLRVKRGVYVLPDAKGLFNYTKILFSKRYRNIDRAVKGLYRCVEMDPEDSSIQTRMFLNAVETENWQLALESFKVLEKTDNEFYKKDQNLWLYLLSFVNELPEEYRERVKNMKFEDISVLDGDLRYKDKTQHNDIRRTIFNHNFKEALDSIRKSIPSNERKIATVITEKILRAVIRDNIRDHDYLYGLFVQGEYKKAKELLDGAKELHGINAADEQFLIVINDMIRVFDEKKIPEIDESVNVNSFNTALLRHDYTKTLEIYRMSASRKSSKSSKYMGILLERMAGEIEKLKLMSNEPVEVLESREVDRTADALFGQVTASLMSQDVESAFELVSKYLGYIGKDKYNDYVLDLIKLGILEGDKGFSEAMYALSDISRDEFEFFGASYIQEFYFNLARKEFGKAAIYLDILNMTYDLGGMKLNTSEMKSRLVEDAAVAGISEEDLGLRKKAGVASVEEKMATIPDDKVLTVAEVMSTVGEGEVALEVEEEKVGVDDKKEETIVPHEDQDEFIEEPSQVAYTVVDVVDRILDDTNLIMLEPMSEEEIQRVVQTTQSFPKIQTIVLEEETGEKRVVLRYVDKSGPYIDIAATLREANAKFRNWEYEAAIDLFQSVLPRLDTPKSFIYSKLGFAYEKTTYDGDYSKAIDYLTMAAAQSSDEPNAADIDYTKIINNLKKKCNYNGLSITNDDNTDSNSRPVQYTKKGNLDS